MSHGHGDHAPRGDDQGQHGHGGGHAHDHGHHFHGEDDPFLGPEGTAFAVKWKPVLETGTAALSEALLDAAHVGPGMRVLDLACGLGPTSVAAAKRGAHVTGLDLNPHTLEQAERHPSITYVKGDMAQPPAGPWGAIVNRFGAHHAPPKWLPSAVATLGPGAWLAIAEWDPDTALFDVEADAPMPTEDTAQDWVERFEGAGLKGVVATQVDFTIDFGDQATFQEFMDAMEPGLKSRSGAPGGRQANRAFIVAGQAG